MLISSSVQSISSAGQLFVKYERPESYRHKEVYKVLKANHKTMYGESAEYLSNLYKWPDDITIVVRSCGLVNSRYLPDQKKIIICYESLGQKIYDYPEKTTSKEVWEKRVYQNVMFTFWHEVGHALMDLYGIQEGEDFKNLELLADEFAAMSMLWRQGEYWKDILMISALHFKSKSIKVPGKNYEMHPPDELRYQKLLVLLYGFAQKSYSKLESQVNQLDWLDISAHEYYLDRYAFWNANLRNHTSRVFFNN